MFTNRQVFLQEHLLNVLNRFPTGLHFTCDFTDDGNMSGVCDINLMGAKELCNLYLLILLHIRLKANNLKCYYIIKNYARCETTLKPLSPSF